MFEYFQLLLTLSAVLIVLLGIMAILGRFIFAPFLALFSIPTYASMIAVEYVTSKYFQSGCPEILRFKKPTTYRKKVLMDLAASSCTLVGAQIAIRLFGGIQDGKSPSAELAQIVSHASDSAQFFIIAMFWIFLLCTYAISRFYGDNPEHPVNKLEDLVIPEWAKKIVEKVKG